MYSSQEATFKCWADGFATSPHSRIFTFPSTQPLWQFITHHHPNVVYNRRRNIPFFVVVHNFVTLQRKKEDFIFEDLGFCLILFLLLFHFCHSLCSLIHSLSYLSKTEKLHFLARRHRLRFSIFSLLLLLTQHHVFALRQQQVGNCFVNISLLPLHSREKLFKDI